MFKEYFTSDAWVQTMPGIYSCLLNAENPENRNQKQIPVKLSSGVSEILFCLRGKVTFCCKTGQTGQLIDQGIVLISDCSQLEKVTIHEPLEGICLSICRSAASESLSNLYQAYGEDQIAAKQANHLGKEWNGMCLLPRQVWSQSMFYSLSHLSIENQSKYCIMKYVELMYLLCSGDAEHHLHLEVWKIERQRTLVEEMQEFLVQNLSEKLTIFDLSRRFHLSPTSCKTSFRAYSGKPIHRWISEKRMEKAATLLKDSDLSILEIAQSLGYSGCSQFNASFKRTYGETPSQYRKNVRFK